VYYYYRVTPRKELANTASYGQFHAGFFAATKATTPLPAPWQSQDVGTFVGPGTAAIADGTCTVIGVGSGISGTTDGFHCPARATHCAAGRSVHGAIDDAALVRGNPDGEILLAGQRR
jgi:hypothetical protein